VCDLSCGTPHLGQSQKFRVDFDALFEQPHELARFNREIPVLRRGCSEGLPRECVIEHCGFIPRLCCRTLRPKPSPDVRLPRHSRMFHVAVECAALAEVTRGCVTENS